MPGRAGASPRIAARPVCPSSGASRRAPRASTGCLKFTITSPAGSDEEEEEEEHARPVRSVRNVKKEKTTPEPAKKKPRVSSRTPTVLPSLPSSSAAHPVLPAVPPAPKMASALAQVPSAAPSSAPSAATTATPAGNGSTTLDLVLATILEVKSAVGQLATRQNRLESTVRDVVNDVVGIRHESRSLVDTVKEMEKKVNQVATVVEQMTDRIPPTPKGPRYDLYDGLNEEEVDEIDDEDDSIRVFAGKIDAILFDESDLPHQERDQSKLRWLMKVVLHRRRHSVKGQEKLIRSLILQRINVNAKRRREERVFKAGLAQPHVPPMTHTPTVSLSNSRSTPASSHFPSRRVATPVTRVVHSQMSSNTPYTRDVSTHIVPRVPVRSSAPVVRQVYSDEEEEKFTDFQDYFDYHPWNI